MVSSSFEFTLNSLSSQIERLDIYDLNDLKDQIKICLPNLTMICVDNVKCNLLIDSNRLKAIKYQADLDAYELEFVRPETLEDAEFNSINRCLKKLINLKFLYLEQIEKLDDDFLSDFKQLTELQFNRLNQTNDFEKLLAQKQLFKLNNLKISYSGLVTLDEYKEFRFSESLNENQLNLQNFNKLSNRLPFINDLNFIENTELPVRFLKKLTNLNRIYVNRKVDDEFKLIKFLKTCNTFPTLDLQDCRLSPSFFNQFVHVHCWFIQTLILGNNVCNDSELNLNFILKLKHLNTLRISECINLNFIKHIYRNLKCLKFFFFFLSSVPYSIECSNRISLSRISSKTDFDNFNDLFNYLR